MQVIKSERLGGKRTKNNKVLCNYLERNDSNFQPWKSKPAFTKLVYFEQSPVKRFLNKKDVKNSNKILICKTINKKITTPYAVITP